MSRLTVGGLLAIALLGLFSYAVVIGIEFASQCPSSCSLSESVAFLLETLGALVSAVVVSELAVTPPGESPGTLLASAHPDYSPGQKSALKILASIYVLTWLISGLALVIAGWVRHPTVAQLNSAAKEWLGYALAAAYAYFGISPKK